VIADDPSRAPDSPARELTTQELDKFDGWAGVRQIYRRGPIAIYDVSSVSGHGPVTISRAPAGADGTNGIIWPTLIEAAVLATGLAVTRRTSGRSSDPIAVWLGLAVGGVISSTIVGVALVAVQFSTEAISTLFLALTAVYAFGVQRRALVRPTLPPRMASAAGASAVALTGLAVILVR
jgi:hypothetical protein